MLIKRLVLHVFSIILTFSLLLTEMRHYRILIPLCFTSINHSLQPAIYTCPCLLNPINEVTDSLHVAAGSASETGSDVTEPRDHSRARPPRPAATCVVGQFARGRRTT